MLRYDYLQDRPCDFQQFSFWPFCVNLLRLCGENLLSIVVGDAKMRIAVPFSISPRAIKKT